MDNPSIIIDGIKIGENSEDSDDKEEEEEEEEEEGEEEEEKEEEKDEQSNDEDEKDSENEKSESSDSSDSKDSSDEQNNSSDSSDDKREESNDEGEDNNFIDNNFQNIGENLIIDNENEEEEENEDDVEEENEINEDNEENQINKKKREKFILELNEFQYKHIKKYSQIKEKKCSICLKNFKGADIIKEFPCKHIYHKNCILKWLKTSNICPLCKYDISNDIDKIELPNSGDEDNIIDNDEEEEDEEN